MKKTYMNPTTKIVMIQTAQMIASSQLGVGTEYKSGNAVLSRGSRSDWDDEE